MDFTFLEYTGSFELAARELARTPEAQDNPELQKIICRKYGILFDAMTNDEAKMLSWMVENYA